MTLQWVFSVSILRNCLIQYLQGTLIPFIQLFRETLSEKVHATIPKGIVGGFEFSVLQRNLKEWHERPLSYVCEW